MCVFCRPLMRIRMIKSFSFMENRTDINLKYIERNELTLYLNKWVHVMEKELKILGLYGRYLHEYTYYTG